jgi:hypothetical protein
MATTSENSELLRRAVREALHLRQGTALTARGLRRRLVTELDFAPTEAEVEAACEFWRGLGQVSFEHDEAGATRWWQITSAGTLACERSR